MLSDSAKYRIWVAVASLLPVWRALASPVAHAQPAGRDGIVEPDAQAPPEVLFDFPKIDDVAFPQIKIDRSEFLPGGRIRLHVTVLDASRKPVPVAKLPLLTVSVRTALGDSFEFPFSRGLAIDPRRNPSEDSENPLDIWDPLAQPRTKTKLTAGVLVVYPTYLVSPLNDVLMDAEFLIRMDEQLRQAIASLVKQLSPGDLFNIVAYGDTPATWVPYRGSTESLRKLELRQLWDECVEARLESYGEDEPKEPEHNAELSNLGLGACGLLSGTDGLLQAIRSDSDTAGHWPFLYGLPTRVQLVIDEDKHSRRLTTQEGPRSDQPRDRVPAALPQALEIAARAPQSLDQRFVVLVTDGRDGYLEAYDQIQVSAKAQCEAQFPEMDAKEMKETRKRGKSALADAEELRLSRLSSCLVSTVNAVISDEQQQFANAAETWLGFALASGIRIHAVGLQTDRTQAREFEFERLRLLARETGGTYRQADRAPELFQQLLHVGQEINNQIIVELTPPFPTGEEFSLWCGAKLTDESEALSSNRVRLIMPYVPPPGWRGFVERQMNNLEDAVGKKWALVIVIVGSLLIVVLVLWLGIKLVKLIFKGLKKLFSSASAQA